MEHSKEQHQQLSHKVRVVADACDALLLFAPAKKLRQAWADLPAPPLLNPLAMGVVVQTLGTAECALESACSRLPPRSKAADAMRQTALMALSLQVSKAPPMPTALACEECGGSLGAPLRESAACMACGREQSIAAWAEEEPVEHTVRVETPSHEKSVGLYVRRLQGHGRDPFVLEPHERDALMACVHRSSVNRRNACARWMRGVLQETRLTSYNDRIPSIMQDIFNIEIPQLNIDEERELIGRIIADIKEYLAMKAGTGPGRRQNALPSAYLAYRHLDAMFAPGDPRRRLLNFIHLQERKTFEKHEEDYWALCKRQGRPFYNIGMPALGPFSLKSKEAVR